MALLVPYARFLCDSVARQGPFGSTLTIGRQLNVARLGEIRSFPGVSEAAAVAISADTYADTFLYEACGATRVEALDYSDYEGATRVWDLNVPVPREWHQQYDTIVDGGTLEHIFQAPLALSSLMQMLRPGGRLFVASPTNNHCGHGFYQFSPEFFYRALSPRYGFMVKRMILFVHAFPSAELSPGGRCYSVADPARTGRRVQLQSARAALLFVEALRTRDVEPFGDAPQQSDYAALWEQTRPGVDSSRAASRWRRLRVVGRPLVRWLSRSPLVRGIVQRWGHASIRNRRVFKPTRCGGRVPSEDR